MSTAQATPSQRTDTPSQKDKNSFVPALIVVDMQNDFVYGSQLAIPGASSIIDDVNNILDLPWKLKIATRDFHPDNHISFAKTHDKPDYAEAMLFHPDDKKEVMGKQHLLWPIHCVAYTGGADFVPGLKSTAFDVVVHKGTHSHIASYSAFKDIWGKETTKLLDIMQAEGITDVFFVGLAGDFCLKYTAIDSLEYGFKSWLVSDGIKLADEKKLHNDEMEKRGFRLTTLKEVQQLLAPESRN